jgi:pimeloyl-ACP methyl ester carboxylesterase
VVPVTGTLAAADGTPLHFEARGSGPPLYVCHGGPEATYSYLANALEPLAQRFTLVYHDYRGCGRSGRAAPESYCFAQLADDLDALRAHLGHERVVVLAHSLGGFVALHYALRHGPRLQGLVLVATTPTGSAGRLWWPALRALGPRRAVRLGAAAAGYALGWAWRPGHPGSRRARYRVLALLQEGREDRREAVQAAEHAAAVASDNAPYLEAEAYRTDLTPDLGHIRCPVLAVCGSRDAVFCAALALYRRHLPSSAVVVLPGVGHHPALEEPEAFLEAVDGFLRDVWRGAGGVD